MSEGTGGRPDFAADAFAGTAQYYARYRVPYPQELIDDLRERSGITGDGKLLDLGCGPGRIALRMSPFFRKVWAIDFEPEMIEVGRVEAKKHHVRNVRWIVGRAEDVEAPPDSFELITIGEAFHRLDQRLIAKRAMELLSPGSWLATMGGYGILSGKEEWQRLVAEIVHKWSSHGAATAPAGTKQTDTDSPRGPDHSRRVLQEAGFKEIESHSFTYPFVWTLESIAGNLYSTSYCSKRVLRERAEGFEADLKCRLLAYDPRGQYPETMRFGYTLARKPHL